MTESTKPEFEKLASLPQSFCADEKAFSIWLEQLKQSNELEILQLLSGALSQMKQNKMRADFRIACLAKIADIFFPTVIQLQETYIESSFPFSEENYSKVSLSARCAFEIAENYALVCKDNSFQLKTIFSQEQKAEILLNSIQAMLNVHLYKALLYEKPRKSFWSLCYLLYLFARKNKVLDISPSPWQPNFESVFKQLLVLELSHTQQFNTKEICTVFKVLKNLIGTVKLLPDVPEKAAKVVPCIDLRKDEAPAILEGAEASSYVFYISCLGLVKQLFEFSAPKNNMAYFERILILRLIKTLAKNQSRKDERRLADNELFAEVGFDNFISFLLHKDSLAGTEGVLGYDAEDLSIAEKTVDSPKDSSEFGFRSEVEASFSLVETSDYVVEYIDSTDIWQEEKGAEKSAGNIKDINAHLIDQSRQGFCIKLKEKGLRTKVGDFIHLYIFSVSVVTVVRRIVSDSDDGVIVGIEVFGYDAKLLHVIDLDNSNTIEACILVDIEGDEGIVIRADEFNNEEFLYVEVDDKNLRYKVLKVLDSSTAVVKHLKVSLS